MQKRLIKKQHFNLVDTMKKMTMTVTLPTMKRLRITTFLKTKKSHWLKTYSTGLYYLIDDVSKLIETYTINILIDLFTLHFK
jgi:hypothetical protein